jgi:hypothetical protein
MPYKLYKSNNKLLATVTDASLDTSTDLAFVGKNYAGYGQTVNENFLKLLENFANSTPPATPIIGELWYDTVNGRLNVNYGGSSTTFKSLANIYFGNEGVVSKISKDGDLWWDKTNGQLKIKSGIGYITIGPPSNASSTSYWKPSAYNINGKIGFLEGIADGKHTVATVSSDSFTVANDSNLGLLSNSGFLTVKKGITLAHTDALGSSAASGYYFWGTASDALQSTTATVAKSIQTLTSTLNQSYYVPFVESTNGTSSVLTSSTFYYNPSTSVLHATATSAYYADLAERYEADQIYDEGTVLIIGGEKEVTTTDIYGHTSVAGVVSKTPAYRMNSNAGPNSTHPYIALKGRVPCKVYGKIQKGDRLVTSQEPGYATVDDGTNPFAGLVGIALEDNESGNAVIEIKI